METLTEGKAFQVDDLKDLQENLFSDKAKEAMKTKATNTMFLADNGDVFQAVYFGSQVPLDKIEDGAKKVAEKINKLAEDGHIHSALSQLIKFDLAKLPGKVRTTLVLCYVLVPLDVAKTLEKEKQSFPLGGVPKSDFEDSLPLELGQFYSEVRIYGWQRTPEQVQESLQKQIDQIMAVLPPGTKHIVTNPCAVTDTSVPFEVIFQNPLLPEVKRVELQYTRIATKLGMEVKDFNILTGVSYYGADNKELYK